jgi:hypothetical protein
MTTPDERLATMPTAPPREAHAPRIALVQRCGDTLLVRRPGGNAQRRPARQRTCR